MNVVKGLSPRQRAGSGTNTPVAHRISAGLPPTGAAKSRPVAKIFMHERVSIDLPCGSAACSGTIDKDRERIGRMRVKQAAVRAAPARAASSPTAILE